MSFGIKLKVWGDYASFNRPEMKVERVSYDVITPSAARGILEAIYWKPQIRWVIDRIHVLRPIRFTHVRRNEISARISVKGATGAMTAMERGYGNLGIAVEDFRQQRAAMVLRDVSFGIEAHFDILQEGENGQKPEAKHLDMFRRRAEKGQYFHHPYLGCREFPADFALAERFPPCPQELLGERDLGYMLHDMVFRSDKRGKIIESSEGKRLEAEPRFFRALMNDGIIDVPPLHEARG